MNDFTFRPMRRNRQALSESECVKILLNGKTGILALDGDGGFPYAVPLNYVWLDGKIYFHCAKEGHKIDAAKRNPKVSFCVVDSDEIVPERFTTRYKSVIVFGTVRVLEGENEMHTAITKLAQKYSPDESEESVQKEIEKDWHSLCMIELSPMHISGKQGLEFMKIQNQQ